MSAVQLVRMAVEKKMIPSAALAIGVKDKLYVKEAFGVTSYTPEATMVNTLTLYDIASVTKIMATTMITLRFIADGLIDLADRLPRFLGKSICLNVYSTELFKTIPRDFRKIGGLGSICRIHIMTLPFPDCSSIKALLGIPVLRGRTFLWRRKPGCMLCF